MLPIDSSTPFNAGWNASNITLNPSRGGFFERTIRKVAEFAFHIPNCIVAACVNPREESRFSPFDQTTNGCGGFTKKIITPDHVPLTADIWLAENATQDTPTILLFNPLGAESSIHNGLKWELIERKCNVITFDYRGLGTTRKADDLVVDGESVYQYATQELGIKSDKVHFYGFSLGGALAAQVKALHPESQGKYVGDRPFRSIFSLITENCCLEKYGSIIKTITSLASAIFIALPVYLLGWEWDGHKAMTQMQGEKKVVYHPNDFLVPFKANLASVCPVDQLIKLNPNLTGPFTHFSALSQQTTVEEANAATVIADFLSS